VIPKRGKKSPRRSKEFFWLDVPKKKRRRKSRLA